MTKRSALAIFCLIAGGALRLPAQSNTGEIFGGYTYAKINPEAPLPKQNSHGWVASAAGYPAKWFGASFDISAHFGDIPAPSGVTAPPLHFKEYSYLAGPQFRFLNTERAQSSFRFLIGGSFGQVRTDSTTTGPQASALGAAGYVGFDQTKFAMLAALPVDFTVSRLFALRVEPGLYLTDFNKSKQGNFRFSVGPVFRFGGK
jgi:hypothetical protein